VLKNLVDKKVSSTDKRLVDITLNDAGNALLERLDLQNEQIDNLTGSLSEDEAKTLNLLLEKIREK